LLTNRLSKQVLERYEVVPRGTLLELRPKGEAIDPATLIADNQALFERFTVQASAPTFEGNVWGLRLYLSYSDTWAELLRRCEAAADTACASRARQHLDRYPGQEYADRRSDVEL
jgi:hypothetical protein